MPLVHHRCRQCSYWWRKRANKIRYSAHRWRHRKRHRHGAEELSYYIWHRPTPKQTHDFVFKVIITNKRCDGLSTDLQSAHDSGQNWAWCDFLANDYKSINVSAVWRTDSCGDSNLQTIPAQIVIESDYARAKLQLHFCLLINIHWSNELCHATPTVAATLFRAMHWG